MQLFPDKKLRQGFGLHLEAKSSNRSKYGTWVLQVQLICLRVSVSRPDDVCLTLSNR